MLLLYGLKSRGTCTLFALHVRLVWERWWFMCCHYLYHYFSIWCVTCLYCSCYILVLLIVDVYKMDVECEVLVHDPCIELLLCFVGDGTFNLWANCSKKEGIMKTWRGGGTFNLWANCSKKEGLMWTWRSTSSFIQDDFIIFKLVKITFRFCKYLC